jgi:Zn-dependent protease
LFGYDFGLMSAAALLVVLLVHELGHLLAMWLLNYRNLSMLFLPFLGAAATGHKPEASAWQEASVLLAGPVMGLVAAFAVSQIPAEVLPFAAVEFARSFVLFGVILNLFNLIPAGILDGGRLFELAVLGRFPYARAVFSSIGMGVGLVYAIWTRSIVFGVVMGLLMFGIPLQFKAARIIATIRQKNKKMLNQALTPELALQALGQEFANGDYGNTGSKQWSGRVNIARLAYPRLLQGIPRLSASIGIFLTHLSVIIATLIVVVLFGWRHPAPIMSSTKAEQSEIDQKYSVAAKAAQDAFVTRYTAEHDPVKKWAMLDQQEEDDIEPIDSTWQNQQRVMLLDQLPNDHEGKLRYQLNESPKVEANLLNIINQLTLNNTRQGIDLDEGKFALLVDVYGLLVQEGSVDVIALHAPMVEKLWLTLNSTNHVYRDYRSQLALISAHIASRQGEIETAKTWMTRYQETGGERAHYISAWFLLDIGHAEQALDLAKQALALPLPPNTNAFTQRNARTQWQTLAGWAEMALGHPQLADSYFQAVLAQREQQRKANRQDQPWWIRLLARSMESNTLKHKWLNEEVLDHVVALHATNPSAARDLFNSLNKQRLPYLDGTVEGWGKARAVAFKQILIQFNIPEKNGAGV